MPQEDRARDQARIQIQSIVELVGARDRARASGDIDAEDDARTAILEDPLSVQVRGPWHNVGDDSGGAEEFQILLCWGGPAVRIVGEIDGNGEPRRPQIEYQDWGTPWTPYPMPDDAVEAVTEYCREFIFE